MIAPAVVRVVLVATATLALAGCGDDTTVPDEMVDYVSPVTSSTLPLVTRDEYGTEKSFVMPLPGGRAVICVTSKYGAALDCDFDHPVDPATGLPEGET